VKVQQQRLPVRDRLLEFIERRASAELAIASDLHFDPPRAAIQRTLD
jgi:hypothetical protein